MDTPDYEKFLEKISADLIGKDIIIKARAKFSDFSNSHEIFVYDFKELNINEELENLFNKINI